MGIGKYTAGRYQRGLDLSDRVSDRGKEVDRRAFRPTLLVMEGFRPVCTPTSCVPSLLCIGPVISLALKTQHAGTVVKAVHAGGARS